ncbi:MAG TPA: fenitrothion hydrolase, partial [Solirubrobacteraceae bacterium]|nr:fenitrothion hydrolase [Solirubrobacteraceae bacterium]
LSIMILAYAAVQIVGMSVYGTEAWSRYGDAFGVYFGLFAMLSPLHWVRGELRARPPLAGAPKLDPVPGTVPLLCTMIGTTSFDGFSQGPLWTGTNGLGIQLQHRFLDLGFNAEVALEIAFTIGLIGVVLLISGLYRLGVLGMQSVGENHTATELGRRFVHSLIPIALAYVIAHYCSLLLYQGQAIGYLISDPLGHGSNIFGTADKTIDYGVINANGVWYVQVIALVLGHACGLALAHDRALSTYRSARAATRSQYWMLVVMIGFTSLGLWLLSAANS